MYGLYARDGERTLPIVYRPGATIVDVGANVGFFSMYAAKRTGGWLTLHAFGPIPPVFDAAVLNLADVASGKLDAALGLTAPLSSRVMMVHCAAMGASDGDLVFDFHPFVSGWSSSVHGLANNDAFHVGVTLRRLIGEVPLVAWLLVLLFSWYPVALLRRFAGEVIPIRAKMISFATFYDTHLRKGDIDLLKIDAEGAEEWVLAGIGEVQWPRVQQIVAEVSDFAATQRVEAELTRRGFTVRSLPASWKRDPGTALETCIVYAVRPAYARSLDSLSRC